MKSQEKDNTNQTQTEEPKKSLLEAPFEFLKQLHQSMTEDLEEFEDDKKRVDEIVKRGARRTDGRIV